MGGAEDLRKALGNTDCPQPLPVYLTYADEREFRNLLYFAFKPIADNPLFDIRNIKPYQEFDINVLKIMPIKQYHDASISIGYRIGDFAYSTDVKKMDEEGFEALKGIKTWILGVTTPSENPKHINLQEALEWINRIKPEKVFLTHMGTRMDYDTLCHELPPHIRPVYDGKEIDIE